MGLTIADGQGKHGDMGVDIDQRGLVQSKSRPSEEVEAEAGRSFVLHGVCRTAAATGGGFLHFKNTSTTHDVIITRIYVDTQTLTDSDLLVYQLLDPTISVAGSDVSSSGITQKNTGSGSALTGVLTISDASADMTFTGGSEYHEYCLVSRASQSRNMMGTNVITPQKSIGWAWKREAGGTATDDQIVSITVNVYVRERE